MTNPTQERNRACRIAYNHARQGEEKLARVWVSIATTFEEPTPSQMKHLDKVLAEASGPIPGQLDIHGSVH